MPSYVALLNWTDQGMRTFNETVDRYEAAQSRFQEMGVHFSDIRWAMGAHDLVGVLDAPDDETLAAALLSLSSTGNLRTTTMRAFTHDEMREVIARAGR
jgi:uncharacterized protein with GYD domain